MPARPAVTLPTFDHLPARWSPSDMRAVLAALDASGLRPFEFARRTGLDPRRIWRARRSVEARRSSAQAGVALVELVIRGTSRVGPAVLVSDAAPTERPFAPSLVVEVTTPTGWALRVPGELLAGLVQALSARPC